MYCNNHSGNILLSIISKDFACVMLVRLQKLADLVCSESQCGIPRSQVRSGPNFLLPSIVVRRNSSFYIAFTGLTKAFDLVSKEGLFESMSKIGYPPKLQSLIRTFRDNMKRTVQFNSIYSECFHICSEVKQGCVLAQHSSGSFLLFSCAMPSALQQKTSTSAPGQLFNLAQIRAKTKVRDDQGHGPGRCCPARDLHQ